MSQYEAKLSNLGLVLPQPLKLPTGMILPFPWVNVHGDRAYVSGHGPQETDGSPAGPFGAVGDGVSIDEAYLDITGTENLFGYPEEIARRIKERIREEKES